MKDVVAAIITQKNAGGENEYLLVRSTENFGRYTGYFYPPAGHVESGENKQTTLIRELKEELGLEIQPVKQIDQTPGDVPDQTTYWWLCDIIDGEVRINSSEIAEVGFFTREQMAQMNCWPATKSFFVAHPEI